MCKGNNEIQLELDLGEVKHTCKTKGKLTQALLDNKDLKLEISNMLKFMEETGTLEAWNDNKYLYL